MGPPTIPLRSEILDFEPSNRRLRGNDGGLGIELRRLRGNDNDVEKNLCHPREGGDPESFGGQMA